MKFILGKKLIMSQKFNNDGQTIPVTVLKAGPCFISQIKNDKTDGYLAVQVGFETKTKQSKPLAGHLKDLPQARYLREFQVEAGQEFQPGQQITAQVFTAGDLVQVSANAKGKGFQGVVKRHHFHGAPGSHGDKDQLRHGGSIGAQRPQRVLKNKRMAGRMGNQQVTVKNLQVIEVDDANNLIYLKGAVPGSRNALVKIVAPGEMNLAAAKLEEAKIANSAPVENIKTEQINNSEIKETAEAAVKN